MRTLFFALSALLLTSHSFAQTTGENPVTPSSPESIAGASLDVMIASLDAQAQAIYTVSLGQQPVTWLSPALQAKDTERTADPTKKLNREFNAMIIQSLTGSTNADFGYFSEGSHDSSSANTNIASGYKAIGQFHTHPWNYEELQNLAFSPQDILMLYRTDYDQKFLVNFPYLILAGTEYYALVVLDADKALTHFQGLQKMAAAKNQSMNDFMNAYFYTVNHGDDIEDITNNSIMLETGMLHESGIAFYRKKPGEPSELLNP